MLLKELNLIGFGKFKNRNLELKDGINLIYGENEAGKSTIHSFIDGMFYGFLRPGARTALYLEEHERYNPWDNSRYAGVIRFSYKDKIYRIERDFSKGKESTKIFDENTGTDITKEIDTGISRILQPGFHFFGFNTRIFSNTISIKQLATKTEDKLASEVREKLINVSTSMDDNISVDKAILELKNAMADIGTDRAPTKPYAQNLKALGDLEERKREILSEKEQYHEYLEEEKRLKDLLIIEEEKLSKIKDSLLKVEFHNKAKRLEEAEILTDEIKRLGDKITTLSPYSKLSMEEYKEAINLSNSIEYISNNMEESRRELQDIEKKLEILMEKGDNDPNGENLVEITKDYNRYEELEDERNTILYNKEGNSLEFIKRDYEDCKFNISKYNKIRLISIILTIISLGIGVMVFISNKYIPAIILLPIFGIIAGYYTNKISKERTNIRKFNEQIEEIESRIDERKNRFEDIESLQGELLRKYDLATKYEFKNLLENTRILSINRENHIKDINETKNKKESLIDKINGYNERKNQKTKRLETIFRESNVNNLEEFNQGLDKKTNYNNSVEVLESKREMLVKVLGEDTLEGLRHEIDNSKISLDMRILNLDKNQLRYEIDRLNQNITDNKIALRGVEENLNRLEKNISYLVEIEEEILRKTVLKEKLELKYKSLQLAVDTIEELSKDIHSQFAPEINRKVSRVVSQITKEKYTNIKISESLDINVENPSTGEIVNINSLSGGTIDQLYFSLRFGIINSMVEENLPLILDDCFIQYDDNRLINIIEFLREISRDRQIILFTCHNREQRILDELGFKYNLINLS